MRARQLVAKLGPGDAKLVGREGMLILLLLFGAAIALVLRFGLPWLDGYLAQNNVMPGEAIPLRLADTYPMLIAYLALYTGALLIGTVLGFLMLDEKDHNTLKALLVTPLPLSQYMLYRISVAVVLAFVIVTGQLLVINQALVPLWQLLLITAGAALSAPLFALFIGIAAENKLAGFAFTKFLGIPGMLLMVSFFIGEPWQWLFGLFPPFWISKAYWLALEGAELWWAALAFGIVFQLGVTRWMIHRFNRVAYR